MYLIPYLGGSWGTPFLDATMKSFRADRSNPTSDPTQSSLPFFTSPPRMSILPSVRIPGLHRSESEQAPANTKLPLLEMKLSSFSFLDSSVYDTISQLPLYTIQTSSTTTTMSRNDPKKGFIKTAVIRWPRVVPTNPTKDATEILVQIQGDSQWDSADTLLKPAANKNAARKFKIPKYSHSMKWKRYGNTYWCTTSSMKGPIAILDRGNRSQPTKLTIYETLHDKYDPDSLRTMQGVSIILLDYVMVTALLLVTDLQEWMLVKKSNDPFPNLSNDQGSSSAPDLDSSQLRKIMYGEPIFPKLSTSESRSKHSSSSTAPMTPGLPRTPTSAHFGTSVYNYAESCYTSSRPSSPKPILPSIAGSNDLNDCESFMIPEIRPSSPLAESFHFSSRRPSHSHFDPSFYGASSQPPVPPLPQQYSRTFSGLGDSSRSSTPLSESSRQIREPPQASISEGSEQLSMSSPLERRSSSIAPIPAPQNSTRTRTERSNSVRSYVSNISQFGPSGRRPLPKPPQLPSVNPSPLVARRVQSSTQLRSSFASASTPSLPSPPPPLPTQSTRPSNRPQRSLPATPSTAAMSGMTSPPAAGQSSSIATSSLLSPYGPEIHSRNPPITKASQEDLTNWVHALTNPQRDLPPEPLPTTSIYDVPPPSYDSIHFSSPPRHRSGSLGR